MVLERAVSISSYYKKPYLSFLVGMGSSIISILLSYFILPEYAGAIMIAFLILLTIPFMYALLFNEEKLDINNSNEKNILKRHLYTSYIYLLLFLGFTIGFCFTYVFLFNIAAGTGSHGSLSVMLFTPQLKTLSSINGRFNAIIGHFATDPMQQFNMFLRIFENNLIVVILSLSLSFVFGSGAIFILGWNASVLGTAMGNVVLSITGTKMLLTGMTNSSAVPKLTTGSFGKLFLISVVRYLPHGIPEIFAYIIAGVAGGIVSVALIKHDFRSKKFEQVLYDVSDLFIISILVLLFAAFIEVYITPPLYLLVSGH